MMQRYLPSYHGSGAVAAFSIVSDRVSAEHKVRRLKEPRVAQSWAFLVWEQRVGPKSGQLGQSCLNLSLGVASLGIAY